METKPTYSTINKCIKCNTEYVSYGALLKWTYINGIGPYCAACIEKGVIHKYKTGAKNGTGKS